MPVCYKPTQVSTVSSTSRQCWCHTLDLDNIIIITPHPPTSVQSAASVVLAKSGGGGGGKSHVSSVQIVTEMFVWQL